jgi:predicted 3-demethylubiquinone-9 3-methyltransferase (glyoxalase superfamily)
MPHALLHASVFPDSHVDVVHRSRGDYPSGKAGDVLLVEPTLNYGNLSAATFVSD